MRGRLIVIEGLDGSGKTTQWELLRKAGAGNSLFVTFPDYDSDSGRIISRYLNGDFGDNTDSNAVQSCYSASSFYAADRYISYTTSWGEPFRNGRDIVSARYTTSNMIYQLPKLPRSEWDGYLDWLCDYEYSKLGLPRPDLTVFLDVPVTVSRELLKKRYGGEMTVKDIHETDTEYLERCRNAALYAARKMGWTVVDCVGNGGLMSVGDIHKKLLSIMEA